jgi:hypothetical protein
VFMCALEGSTHSLEARGFAGRMAPIARASCAAVVPWTGLSAAGVRAIAALRRAAADGPATGTRASPQCFEEARGASIASDRKGGTAGGEMRACAPAAVAGRGRPFGDRFQRASAAGFGRWAASVQSGARAFHASGPAGGGGLRAKKDPYETLGVTKSATAKEIKKAYLMKARTRPHARHCPASAAASHARRASAAHAARGAPAPRTAA